MKYLMFIVFIMMGLMMAGVGALILLVNWIVGPSFFSMIAPSIFVVVGLFMAVYMGIAPLVKSRAAEKQEKHSERPKNEVTMVWAEYESCVSRVVGTVDGQPVRKMVLRCRYVDPDGQEHIFIRTGLEEDPQPYLKDGRLRVYFQQDDRSKYYIDLANSYVGSGVVEE